ncbi:hypothetical protein L3X38_002559 [Prunus dulcis]|uniref:Reverse transcriptase domain-containing protein n=1 Tax=Prunus dulcis TaxID=3755 RepID=A0AAD4WU57_PRUDU|nr:hypothetical protein L3X38_002559 [Prunus dulcis]
MKLLVSNSRGSAWHGFVLQALFYISTLCLDLFCILDSKTSRAQADRLALRLGFSSSFCVPAIGGSQAVSPPMMNFNKFINDCEVISMNASGVPFTWCNGHCDNSIIYKRLDRALVNPDWMSLYPHYELQNLPTLRSDYGPILLTCNHIPRRIPKAFRFEAMWLAQKDFDKVVTQTWNSAYSGNAAQKLQTCCNTFKHQLKSWNRNVFGDLFLKLKTAQENLHLTPEQLAQNPYNPYLPDKDSKLHTELKILLEQEEVFYAQKARANWLQLGDKNTKYFHTQAFIRQKRNQILRIKDPSGIWVKADNLPQCFIEAFKLRFKADQAPNQHLVMDFLQIVEPCVTSQDNINLLAPVSDYELELAIKGIGSLKAPGPDGLQAIFYHKCWENTKQMVKDLVNEFLSNNIPLQDVNHTNIALIPKVESLETTNHYRPISLCNVSYKIITKILVNRLRPILSKCISKNQGAFAPGRSIFDNILIAHELFHDFKRKKGARGAMAIKLDLEKAYDLLDWGYIRGCLAQFGFCNAWCD